MAAMAFVARARKTAILLLFLVLHDGCVGARPLDVAEALAKAKDVSVGKVGSNVKSFNVLDYGAKADGKKDSSINFIRTFKAACNFHGDAMMVIPEGDFLIGPVIFSGPCFNPSSLIIQANGMVKAQSDISYYTGGADGTDWITFQSLKNGLILSGDGTFHGQGAHTWKYNDCAHKSKCVRLPAVSFELPIGSLGHYDDEADVSKISVINSTLKGTTNGARIKTYKTDSPSKASDITFKDLIMDRVANPIIIDQEYGNRASTQESRVSISDIHFENIKGTSESKIAVKLICSKLNPCRGVQVKNVNLQYVGRPNDPRPFSSNCTNAKVTYSGIQRPPPCTPGS
ncbi:hypothetical protein V6N11_046614 [Hibiscus sabdariffa]|uniref:Exopolygalacturonase n=1 Tax=Hibiscus sabdariffa TaxID=183260 RepID=A0ABR2P2R3_9ROSI